MQCGVICFSNMYPWGGYLQVWGYASVNLITMFGFYAVGEYQVHCMIYCIHFYLLNIVPFR
ncbi:hypothetical protein KL86APRO_30078 [uncultured Alphaproteobacteria bacterium]|uniref:Uncharacterized protein n=1 Tax=uncultured Alphaproteobacteria bacterium TaxID=91750 RepID=A0A212KLI8_9PROT|nr:hypothetical protein KL86APRO_30078 [uncultured Alphaproteobacteria bacterium]